MQTETAGSHSQDVWRQLKEDHRRYSEQIEGLSQRLYLSAEQQLEEVRLKKLKLRIKDVLAGNLPVYRVS